MPPISELFEVRNIPNAGRGVIASRSIPAGSAVFESGPPAFNVIFSDYKKETCAQCFFWDRGRTLPEREHELGKVFCSQHCRNAWVNEQGPLAVEACKAMVQFVRQKNKHVREQITHDEPRPKLDRILARWREAEKQAAVLRSDRGKAGTLTGKAAKALLQKATSTVYPNLLSYFLSGVLFRYRYPSEWEREVMDLAMDDEPYRSDNELEAHCNTMVQLMAIIPLELATEDLAETCHAVVKADNHNAFGLNSGTNDEEKEEYMGYAVYPSSSYFNHSCSPNLTKSRRGRSWQFVAIRDIMVGEEMCITYLGGAEKELDVVRRRDRLKEVWGFCCNCRRCISEQTL